MSNPFVFLDGNESNRFIPEPRILRRIRRIKEVWNAAVFLVRGGKFKVYLDFSGVDPHALRPVRLFVHRDGMVIDVEQYRRNLVANAARRLEAAGLHLAKEGEPGFRVFWGEMARAKSWEEAGFDVTRTPVDVIVQPKGAA